jgi:Leucine-rich repeat (LRR) protein
LVKTCVLLAGFFGIANLSSTFAAGTELNSGNIVGLGCATDATDCNLSNKGITSIATDAFINHTLLQTLYLYTNQIASIESGDFAGLDSLIELRLNDNSITSLESGDFAGLGNLDYLYLFSNKIASIESGVFDSLSGLKYV